MTKAMTHETLTEAAQYAQQHFDGPSSHNPYLWSSDMWLAFQAGRAANGMSPILCAQKSRGYSIRLTLKSGSRLLFSAKGAGLDRTEWQRLA